MLFVFNPFWLFVLQSSYFVVSAPTGWHAGYDNLTSDAAAVVLPMQRRALTTGKYLDLPAIANHMRAKHGFTTIDYESPEESHDSLQRRINFNSVEMFDDVPDISYFATIGVGTPPKKFNVVLDTGSSDLFLSSTICNLGCGESVAYNPANSRTFQGEGELTTITLGSVTVTGELASDLVLLGGFRVNPQTFAVATTIQGEILGDRVSGLLGLGFQPSAQTGAVPFVQSLVNSNRLEQPIMSFSFQRHMDDPETDIAPGGTLTLGSIVSTVDPATIEQHPVVLPGSWAISLEAITSQGNPIPIPSTLSTAIIDTGSTLIAAPSSIVAAVCQRIGGDVPLSGRYQGFCVIPCNLDQASLEMAFTFTGGNAFPVNPIDLVYPQPNGQDDPICVLSMFDLTPNTAPVSGLGFSWVIGLSFLKNVYTVFDFNPPNPSVGFAPLPLIIPPPPPSRQPVPPVLPTADTAVTNTKPRPASGVTRFGTSSVNANPSIGKNTASGTGRVNGKLPCSSKKKFLGIFRC